MHFAVRRGCGDERRRDRRLSKLQTPLLRLGLTHLTVSLHTGDARPHRGRGNQVAGGGGGLSRRYHRRRHPLAMLPRVNEIRQCI